MKLFEKNRNELSKYCYDLSKALLIGCIAIPIIQENFKLKLGIAFSMVSVTILLLGLLLKEKN